MIQNLPWNVWFKMEYVIIVSTIPGIKEPNYYRIAQKFHENKIWRSHKKGIFANQIFTISLKSFNQKIIHSFRSSKLLTIILLFILLRSFNLHAAPYVLCI